MKALRLRRLAYVFLGILALLIGRLFQLQIQEHDYWVQEARNSRLDRASIPFQRGRILDRNGVVLAMDKPSYDLYFRYRDFRRGHVAGQLHEALAMMDIASGGLAQCLELGEELGAMCLAWTPADLRPLGSRRGDDLIFYLRGITDMQASQWRLEVQDWQEHGTQPFQVRFPGAVDGLRRRLADARRELELLEGMLGVEWYGALLPRLEDRRQVLEHMVLSRSLQEAAGRAFGVSASTLRSRLKEPATRMPTLQELRARWNLEASPEALGALLAPVAGEQAGTADQEANDFLDAMSVAEQSHLFDDYLSQLEQNYPDDAGGIRRDQTYRVHRFRVIALVRDLDFTLVDLLAQQADDYPGLYLHELARRIYPEEITPLLVGNTRSVGEREAEQYQATLDRFLALRRIFDREPAEEAEFRQLRHQLWSDTLRPEETLGASGIERVYEEQLRGSRGYLQVLEGGEEDGRPLELLFSPPRNGSDIVLSFDVAMERAAQKAIQKVYRDTTARLGDVFPETPAKAYMEFDPSRPRVGFALIDLQTGGTPVLTSVPSFTRSQYREEFDALNAIRNGSPLRHRALGGGFSGLEVPYPGSTFKPLVAAAAMAEDPNLWSREYDCQAFITPAAGVTLKCDSKYGHGVIDMHEALKKSCNVYFYLLARDLGPEPIYRYAYGLGFDRPTGLELVRFDPAAERVDLWKGLSGDARLERGANFLTDYEAIDRSNVRLMRTAIGQVGVQASPLQMARFYGWLATGNLLTPRLVTSGGGGSAAEAERYVPSMSRATRERIVDALLAVSYEPGGTAVRTEFPEEWQIVAKTGTAQVGGGPTHAWFTGYFPADEPRYAFAVLCENTGLHGGQIASFVLKEFLESPEGASLFASTE
ncbi:MAG: penicillin-binding transpeptidase domain-containing protein [Planctomycetota bacterium]